MYLCTYISVYCRDSPKRERAREQYNKLSVPMRTEPALRLPARSIPPAHDTDDDDDDSGTWASALRSTAY